MPTSDQPAPAIDCEKCGAPMKLLGSLPRLGVYPELRTYKCDACRRVETTVAEWPPDPSSDSSSQAPNP